MTGTRGVGGPTGGGGRVSSPLGRWLFFLVGGMVAVVLLVRAQGGAQDTMSAPPSPAVIARVLDRTPIQRFDNYRWMIEQCWVDLVGDPLQWRQESRLGEYRIGVAKWRGSITKRQSVRLPLPDEGEWVAILGAPGTEILGAASLTADGRSAASREITAEFRLLDGRLQWTPLDRREGLRQHVVVRLESSSRRYLICYPDIVVTDRPHLLGTDDSGEDLLIVLLRALPRSVLPGMVAVAIGVVGGIFLGTLGSGSFGRLPKVLVNLVTIIGLSFPLLLVMLLAIATLKVTQLWLMVVLGVACAPRMGQVVGEKIRSFQRSQFVEAALELGMSRRRILGRQILWANGRALLFTQATFLFADVVMLEATISYLQFGRGADIQSLGGLIARNEGRLSEGALWPTVPAMVLLSIIILALYLLGDRLGRQEQSA